MPTVAISDELHSKIEGFKQVLEAVLDEPLSFDQSASIILERGIHSMLNDIIGALPVEILRESIHQLGTQHPAEVYGYVADNLKRGALETERQRLRRQIGFLPHPLE